MGLSLSPPLLWLSLRPMLPLMPGMDIMYIPAITDTAVTDTMVDTTVWDTADTTADTGRGKPRLRPNPLPPLRPTPLPMPTTDTTDTAVLMDTTVDTTDMVWDTTAVTADTGRGKPRLRPNPKLMPPLMLGTDTTVIVMDTTVILIDTTDTDTVMPVLTDTTAVTGGKL